MIDIEFVSGINRARLAKSLKKAGITHRFAVIQHKEIDRSDKRAIDARPFWALLDFMSDYDPQADLFYVENFDDIGVRERPIDDLIAQWKSAPTGQRLLPDAFLARNRGRLQLCMICEAYGLEGPWPYNDSDTFALLSRRDISREVPAYLGQHENAALWTLSSRVVDIRETGRRLPLRNRTRENTEPPRRGRAFLWTALTIAAFTAILLAGIAASIHSLQGARDYAFMASICVCLALAVLLLEARDIDVSLTWDGVRNGKGPRSRFIAWDEARLDFKKDKVIVRSKTQAISVRQGHFDETKFWVFFRLIYQEIETRGLKRADEGRQIKTPAYVLSENEVKSFWKYSGKGSGKSIFSDLQPLVLPVIIIAFIALLIWIGPQRHRLPHVLLSPPMFIAATSCVTALFCAASYIGNRLFFPDKPPSKSDEMTLCLTEVGLVGQGAHFRHIRPWDEIRWIVQTPTPILFFSKPGVAILLPKRIFSSPAEATDVFNQALAFKKAYVAGVA